MSEISSMKEQVLETSKRAFGLGLFAGTSGNLSMVDAARELVAITPSSRRYETMVADDISIIRFDGTRVEGPYRPSSEWRLHTAILRSFPDTGAVVHTHSPYATAFAVTHAPIPLILIELIAYLGGDVQVAPFELPGTEELGRGAVAALSGGRSACLLANHGVLAIGRDLEQALLRAEYVEDAARIYTYALGTGTPKLIPEAGVAAMFARMRNS